MWITAVDWSNLSDGKLRPLIPWHNIRIILFASCMCLNSFFRYTQCCPFYTLVNYERCYTVREPLIVPPTQLVTASRYVLKHPAASLVYILGINTLRLLINSNKRLKKYSLTLMPSINRPYQSFIEKKKKNYKSFPNCKYSS